MTRIQSTSSGRVYELPSMWPFASRAAIGVLVDSRSSALIPNATAEVRSHHCFLAVDGKCVSNKLCTKLLTFKGSGAHYEL